MLRYRLQHGEVELEVAPGRFVVGRSAECNLVLDDPLVSRRHAAFLLEGEALTVEDLGSRNGVQVNGATVQGRRALADGDVVTLGGHDLKVLQTDAAAEGEAVARVGPREGVTTLTFEERTQEGPTLLARVLDKALAMGRGDEAERILANLLADASKSARSGRALDHAARCAFRVASATGRMDWVDRVFLAYEAGERVMPAPMVDEVHALVRRARHPLSDAVKRYAAWLQARADRLSPSERFALQRMEALVRGLRGG